MFVITLAVECLPLRSNAFSCLARRRFSLCSHLPCCSSTERPAHKTANSALISAKQAVPAQSLEHAFKQIFPLELEEEWTEKQIQLAEKAESENAWTPVYRYHGLVKLWLTIRLNLVILFFSIGLFIYTVGQKIAEKGIVDLLDFWPHLVLLLLAFVITSLVTKHLTRTVGVISVDKQSRSIYRIGHLTGWGARRNQYARLGDLQPIVDSNPGGIGSFPKICWTFRPKRDFLVLPTENCEILDEEAVHCLFETVNFYGPQEGAKVENEKLNAGDVQQPQQRENSHVPRLR